MQTKLPPPQALKWLSLGNVAVAADFYYLRAVSTFGDRNQHAAHYPSLAPLLQQSVALDPTYLPPYLLAGSSLLLAGNDQAAGVRLLKQGCNRRPDSWLLPFYLGFYAYNETADLDEATAKFVAAARLPGSPPFLGPLASRTAALSREPAVGLQLLDTLVQVSEDASVRASLLSRRPALLLEVRLTLLQNCVDGFAASEGALPTTLKQLVPCLENSLQQAKTGEGLLAHGRSAAQIIEDPLGGEFFLTGIGQVATHHQAARMKLQGASQ